MENKKIGIKVADGSFYPILDEGSLKKKRLVLTTVNDGQSSVQIDLYRGAGEKLEGASYIGSLLVDEIEAKAKGEAEIELTLGVDEDGTLHSLAKDRASGLKQSFSVGLENLDATGLYEVPDFDFTEEDSSFETAMEEDEDILGEDFDFSEEELSEEEAAAGVEDELDSLDFEEELGEEPTGEETVEEKPVGEEPAGEASEVTAEEGEEDIFADLGEGIEEEPVEELAEESLPDFGDEDFELEEPGEAEEPREETSVGELEEESPEDFSLDETGLEEPFDEELPDLGDELEPDFGEEEEAEEDFDFSSLGEPPEEEALSGLEEEASPEEEVPGEASEEGFEDSFGEDIFGEDTFGDESPEEPEEEAEDSFFQGEEPEEAPVNGWGKDYNHLKKGFDEKSSIEEKETGRAKPLLVVLLVIVALALIGALLYLFVFLSGDRETVPPLEAKDGQAQEQVVTVTPAESETGAGSAGTGSVGAGPAGTETTGTGTGGTGTSGAEAAKGEGAATGQAGGGGTTAVAGTGEGMPSKDRVEFTGGVWYKIRWGDTLWEISSSFYDDPWLYGKIADENEISNPDRIYAESNIFIPRQ